MSWLRISLDVRWDSLLVFRVGKAFSSDSSSSPSDSELESEGECIPSTWRGE